MFWSRLKSLLLFVLKWVNGLLFLLFTAVSVDSLISGEISRTLIHIPGLNLSAESILIVAFLLAFLGAKNLGNESKRNLAKWGNILAIPVGVWELRHMFFEVRGGEKYEASIIMLGVFVTLIPLINLLVFWRQRTGQGAFRATGSSSSISVSEDQGDYFATHWRGFLPLGASFWINGWMVIASVLAFQKILDGGSVTRNPRTAAILYALIYVVAIVLTLWLCVGIWRSATRQIYDGRRPVWGALAKLSILLFLLNQIGPAVWIYFPKAREHLNDIVGRDSIEGYQIQVSASGEIIEFRGGLRFGSAKALQRTLTDFPNARVLKIDSPGGRVGEALRMMGMIRERGLTTYASQRCMSAATLVLTAGKERGAEHGTRIGFHASKNPSGNAQLGDASVMGSMVSAGISEKFVKRVLSIPADRMWFPTAEEMLKAGVLTSYGVFPPQSSTNRNATGGASKESSQPQAPVLKNGDPVSPGNK